jgi:hypothetical protein
LLAIMYQFLQKYLTLFKLSITFKRCYILLNRSGCTLIEAKIGGVGGCFLCHLHFRGCHLIWFYSSNFIQPLWLHVKTFIKIDLKHFFFYNWFDMMKIPNKVLRCKILWSTIPPILKSPEVRLLSPSSRGAIQSCEDETREVRMLHHQAAAGPYHVQQMADVFSAWAPVLLDNIVRAVSYELLHSRYFPWRGMFVNTAFGPFPGW